MMKCIRNNKGHYIIEASIVLPLLIIVAITIGSIIKIDVINENVVFASVDEGRAAIVNSVAIGDDITLKSRLLSRLEEENSNITNVKMSKLVMNTSTGRYNHLTSFDIDYDLYIKAPLPLFNESKGNASICYRKFVGDDTEKEKFGFENMEREGDDNIVYLFPIGGKKYHRKTCTYVTPKATEIILRKSVRNKYDACKTCKSDKCKDGDTVYYFAGYGEVYHLKNCKTIEKNIISIDRNIAEEKGYTKCSKCGG